MSHTLATVRILYYNRLNALVCLAPKQLEEEKSVFHFS